MAQRTKKVSRNQMIYSVYIRRCGGADTFDAVW
jgi:hypothetical protein